MPRLYHVGITVSDMDRSVAFYRDVVGMKETKLIEAGGLNHDRLTDGRQGTWIKVVHMLQDGFILQLVQYVSGGGEPLQLHHSRPASPHLSFSVSDVAAKRKELEARGTIRLGPMVTIGAQEKWTFYCYDPDGVPVEFIEDRKGEAPAWEYAKRG